MAREHMTEKASVHYIKDIEQTERWRREFIQKKEYEVNLAAVSKLYYEETDYAPLLETAPFPELTLTNYDHLYGQAAKRVEEEFKTPIMIRIGLFFVFGVLLLVFISVVMLVVITILSGILAASLVHTKKQKEEALERAAQLVEAEIQKRHEEETSVYAEAKATYEKTERERIESIQSLLNGNPNAIGSRLIDAFKTMQLPIMVDADLEYFNNVPLAKVRLPSKGVIPVQTCELLPSGRLQYKDKEMRSHNKQYFELTLAVMMQISLMMLANIPSFEYCYAHGLSREEEGEPCLIALKITRENAGYANRVGSALSALQFVDASFNTDTNFIMSPVEAERPPEWGDAEKKSISSIAVKIFR
ncbi:MAG: hypothetical protein LBR56_02395 [Sporomusaceae bacterium]|jgi:uncharacterized membrane protein|nr:hypothetical protein [Sporomusaceae bacterium]